MTDHAAAKLVRIGDRDFVIGAEWTAPIYTSKPRNLYNLVRQENYNPEATLAAYVRDELQIGWYVFPDAQSRPGRTPTLASVLLKQLSRRSTVDVTFPLTAIINLGECFWLIIFDSNRNILPGFDLWGTQEEIYGYLDDPDYAGTIEAFRDKLLRFDDANVAMSWLFEGIDRNFVYAEPVRPTTVLIRNLAFGAAAFVMLAIGWHFVSDYLHARELAADREKLAQILAQQREQEQAIASAQRLQQTEFNERLEAYWRSYPKPWVGAPSVSTLLSACQTAIDNELPVIDGWQRADSMCTPVGPQLTVSEDWNRGKLATVFAMPEQAVFSLTGDKAQTQRVITLDPPEDPPASPLGDSNDLHRQWVGTGQRFEGVIKTEASAFVPFVPPVPPWVPASKIKQVQAETPVLWHQETVKITSAFAPWDGWPLPVSPTFIVGSITVKYSDNGPTWTLSGVQYAQ